MAAYLVPVALCSAELATTVGGGMYRWVRDAFGSRWGFLAVWCDWSENIVWFPGGHPLYLRTVLSEGFDFDPRTSERLVPPRSLAAAIGDHLQVLAPDTRSMLEMLSVLNLRIALAQLGQAAQVDSPSAAIEPAVASGLVDWWPQEPTCPVEIHHLLVRDAVYAGITATNRRLLHAPATSVVSEPASWEHRVAALDRPEEGLAAFISRKAVEYHLGNIYAKCGLPGRQQLRRFVGQWAQPAAV